MFLSGKPALMLALALVLSYPAFAVTPPYTSIRQTSPVVGPLQIAAVGTDAPSGNDIVRETDVAMASPSLAMAVYLDDGIHYSLFNGSSWTQLTYNEGVGSDGAITYDAATNQFVCCWKAGNTIMVNRFDVGSGQFGTPQLIYEEYIQGEPTTVDKPWIARGELIGGRQELYMSWHTPSTGRYARSQNSGANWVIGTSGSAQFGNQLSVANASGAPPYLAYPLQAGWRVQVGADILGGGTQFSDLQAASGPLLVAPVISPLSPLLGSDIPGPSPTKRVPYLAADPTNSDQLYMVYYDVIAGTDDVDVFCAKLVRSSSTNLWAVTLTKRVNDDAITGDDKDQFCPAAVVDDSGRVHVVWYDDRNFNQSDGVAGAKFDAYYAYSLDGGANFTNVQLTTIPAEPALDYGLISGSFGFLSPGEYPGIAVASDTVLITLAGTWSGSSSSTKTVLWSTKIQF